MQLQFPLRLLDGERAYDVAYGIVGVAQEGIPVVEHEAILRRKLLPDARLALVQVAHGGDDIEYLLSSLQRIVVAQEVDQSLPVLGGMGCGEQCLVKLIL